MELLKYPNPILLQKCESVAEINDELKAFVKELTLFTLHGLKWGIPTGLAAPQVGKPIRLFVTLGEVFINPEIVWMTKAPKNTVKEGCYSLEENNFEYSVERAQSIRLKWQDLNGQWHEERFNGYKAQILQHEYDHLDGILINSKQNENKKNQKENN